MYFAYNTLLPYNGHPSCLYPAKSIYIFIYWVSHTNNQFNCIMHKFSDRAHCNSHQDELDKIHWARTKGACPFHSECVNVDVSTTRNKWAMNRDGFTFA